MSERQTPAVTISLVTWNGLRWLPGCLDSVAAQTLADYELLILDNGSDDGSVEWLRARVARDPRITLVESDRNLGYAPAHNRNIEAARGEAVLLLNQDVELDHGFLEAAVSALTRHRDVAAVQPLVWRLDGPGVRSDVVDSAGLVMHRDRRVVSRDQLQRVADPGAYRAVPVWGADGPAPVYRRSALLQAREPRSGGGLEILDEDFFAYKEDVDLAWRLQRLGWGAWFEPSARAWHARGGGDTGVSGWREVVRANMANPPEVRTLSWRNQRLMQLKNEEAGPLLRDLPWVASRELQSWLFVLFADPRRLRAVPALLRALPAARRKRRHLGAAVRLAREGRSRPKPLGARLLSRMRVSVAGKVIVHARVQGWRATLDRATEKVLARLGAASRGVGFDSPVPEVRPDRVRIELDRPRLDAREGAPRAMVLGWAHAESGVTAVELYLDGAFVAEAFTGRARPDVEVERQHLSVEGIAGFGAIVPLAEVAPGPHVLHVVARDRAGNVRALARPFTRIDPVEGYERLYRLGQAELAATMAERGPGTEPPRSHVVIAAASRPGLAATLGSLAAQREADWTCSILAAPEELTDVLEAVADLPGEAATARCSVTSDPAKLLPASVDPHRLVLFLFAGERLSPLALAAYAAGLRDHETSVVYADHDAIDPQGRHVQPWFVPGWSPDRLLAQDYIRGAFAARDGSRLRAHLPDLVSPQGSAWRYRLLLALAEPAAGIEHVPRVLWSEPLGVEADRASEEAAAVTAELERRGAGAATIRCEPGLSAPVRRIEWPAAANPRVSVIIPTTGRMDLVQGILETLAERTAYPDLERIFIDNGRGAHPDGVRTLVESGATVIERNEPFNWSRLNNAGAAAASGELLLFLNDDVKAIEPGWMDDLVQQVQRPDVGVVGSLLLYPDGAIQHAGVLLVGHGGGAAHLLQGLDPDDALYLDMQRVRREASAVTGACLMVERSTFEEVGGFDEELEVSGNDVDFCLRVATTGRRVLWTPYSHLIHHESRSRGSVAYVPDQVRLWRRWSSALRAGDPFFNPNLDQDRVDCDLDWSRLEV